MAAIDITGAGGGGTAITVSATSPVVSTLVGSNYDISLDQTQFKTINGNSIFGAGNIVISTGLTNWTEAFASGTQATSSFTALNAATNVNAALVPKGTGAIVGNIPNGAVTGGNARGQYAVDLQLGRNNANQVASGNYSVLTGGINNRVSGNNSGVLSGASNFVSGSSSFIGSGTLNSISSSNSGINSGQNNSISASDAAIVAGNANSATGQYSFIGGGQNNTSSGLNSVINGGSSNLSSGSKSAILGGDLNTASTDYTAILGGYYGNAYFYGQKAHANGRFTINGDAQGSEAIYRLDSGFTNGQTKEIFLDGASVRLTPFTNSALTINFDVVAIVTAISGTATGVTVGDMFSQNEIVALKNVAGTTTVVGSHNIYNLHDGSMSGCDTTYLNTGTALSVNFNGPNFTGGGTVTLRIVVKARIVETRY